MHNIKLIALDVDGTLTDGTLAYSENDVQAKAFHVADGLGIVMAQAAGLKIAIISGRSSRAVERRMTELKVTDLIQNCGDKFTAIQALLVKYELRPDEAAYVGDDINDLPAFDSVGVKIAVANAEDALKAQADWITPRSGGHGAVRDAIDEILRRQGRSDEAVQAYLDAVKSAEAARQ